MTKNLRFVHIMYAVLAALVLMFAVGHTAMADNTAERKINMYVDGFPVAMDTEPYLYKDYTMVPLRFASGTLNATLLWDGETQTATLIKGSVVIELTIGKEYALINGEQIKLPVPVQLKDDRTFIPVRFISETLGGTVNWENETSTVQIYFPRQIPFKIIGYYYDSDSLTMAREYLSEFTDIIHFNYEITADGQVSEKKKINPDLYADCAPMLRISGRGNQLLVTGFDKESLNNMLADPLLRGTAINNLCDLARSNNYSGIDIDFEAVNPEQRENYVNFVKELRAALPSYRTLSLSLIPRNSDRQTWLDGYDYEGLAKHADFVNIMFYNQSYAGSIPGPVAGADWMEECINYLLKYIPRHKIVAGLGCYGYNWPTAGGNGVSVRIAAALEMAERHGAEILRDAKSGVPYYTYISDDGEARTVWFEDGQSLAQKAALAKKYGFAGIAIWRMGFFPNEVLDEILAAVK